MSAPRIATFLWSKSLNYKYVHHTTHCTGTVPAAEQLCKDRKRCFVFLLCPLPLPSGHSIYLCIQLREWAEQTDTTLMWDVSGSHSWGSRNTVEVIIALLLSHDLKEFEFFSLYIITPWPWYLKHIGTVLATWFIGDTFPGSVYPFSNMSVLKGGPWEALFIKCYWSAASCVGIFSFILASLPMHPYPMHMLS